ncbi:MAG: ABC transporter permease [Pseudomonadota bacterium]
MIRGWTAVYYREFLILRRRLTKLIPAWSVSPLLYIVAFGYAVGRNKTVDGHPYLEFLLPGLVAMSGMTQSFAISSEINISRFYWHIFEEFQSAPIGGAAYVLGETLASMTRAFLSCVVILVLGAAFGVFLSCNLFFWLAFFLNSLIFATLAVSLAMLVKSHADQSLLNSFIITPMAFLGGTFFPVDQLPPLARSVLGLLPLTHASRAIRASAYGQVPQPRDYLVLAALGAASFVLAMAAVRKAGH